MSEKDNTIIGIACERSVVLDEHLDENGYMKDNPNVKIIQVPCSGQIQPIMLETALKKGASGTFALGCRIGDCHYREGNKFCRERLLGQRMPKLKPNIDKQRVEGYWLSAVEYDKLQQLVSAFSEKCAALDNESAPAASAK